MKEKIKDIVIRALKTFIQGFIATLLVLIKDSNITDTKILKSIIIGALAGGISAVMNFVYNLLPKTPTFEENELVSQNHEMPDYGDDEDDSI